MRINNDCLQYKDWIMKKIFVGLLLFLIGASSVLAQTNMSSEMYDLAKIADFWGDESE